MQVSAATSKEVPHASPHTGSHMPGQQRNDQHEAETQQQPRYEITQRSNERLLLLKTFRFLIHVNA